MIAAAVAAAWYLYQQQQQLASGAQGLQTPTPAGS
jgi:hypothetical protein